MPRHEPPGRGDTDAARRRNVSAIEGYRSRRRLRDRPHQGSRRTHLRGVRRLLRQRVAGMRRLQDAEEPVMDRLKLPGIFAAGLLAWQAVALANSPAQTEE